METLIPKDRERAGSEALGEWQKLGHLPHFLLQGRVILIAAVSPQGHGLFETSLAEAEACGETHSVMTKGIISPDIFMFILPSLLREIGCCSSLCGLINIPEESIKREQQPRKGGSA